MTSVYAVSDVKRGHVKVGMSRNLAQRMADLCRPSYCKLIHSVECEDARLVERVAHYLLRGNGRFGEWFDVTEGEAIDAIERARLDVSGDRKLVAVVDAPKVNIRATEAILRLVDDWRREEPDLPSRSEAIRRMIQTEGERRQKGKKR